VVSAAWPTFLGRLGAAVPGSLAPAPWPPRRGVARCGPPDERSKQHL